MSFLYELGINDFVNNIAELLSIVNPSSDDAGVALTYIDDFYWAAPFESAVKAIKLVNIHGQRYGYRLSMSKSIYLKATPKRLLAAQQLDARVQKLIQLGVSLSNVKTHPSCQPGSPLKSSKRSDWDFKALGALLSVLTTRWARRPPV